MVTAVDLVPLPFDAEQLPDNFRMEVDDINLGLSHYYGRFDLVHMCLVEVGLKGKTHFLIILSVSPLRLFALSPLDIVPPRPLLSSLINPPLLSCPFECSTMLNICVTSDRPKTLREIQKCLKPGGMAMVLALEPFALNEKHNGYHRLADDTNLDGFWGQ